MAGETDAASGRFSDVSFFLVTPAIVTLYAGFLRFQAAPFDAGSLLQSIFFAAAFTLPGWWFAWMTTWVLVRLGGGRAPVLAFAAIGYVLSLLLFRPYYSAVYDLIALAQPWMADLIATRHYGFDLASVAQLAKINTPGLVIWLIAHGLAIRLLGYSPYGTRTAVPARQVRTPKEALPEFLHGLGIASVGDLLYLEAEEHYLRVVTRHGSKLIRCRMRDAIAALPPGVGLQVHRSWWVSKAAVTCAAPAGKSVLLLMRDGARVPVSLGYREAVKNAGIVPRVIGDDRRKAGVMTAHS
jgi:LytTr DNA-binding domain